MATLGSTGAMDHLPIFRCCKCIALSCWNFNI